MENEQDRSFKRYIDEVILNMTDFRERRCAYLHLYGVAFFCTMIALKRGENAELATIAGMLHDLCQVHTGINNALIDEKDRYEKLKLEFGIA